MLHPFKFNFGGFIQQIDRSTDRQINRQIDQQILSRQIGQQILSRQIGQQMNRQIVNRTLTHNFLSKQITKLNLFNIQINFLTVLFLQLIYQYLGSKSESLNHFVIARGVFFSNGTSNSTRAEIKYLHLNKDVYIFLLKKGE